MLKCQKGSTDPGHVLCLGLQVLNLNQGLGLQAFNFQVRFRISIQTFIGTTSVNEEPTIDGRMGLGSKLYRPRSYLGFRVEIPNHMMRGLQR